MHRGLCGERGIQPLRFGFAGDVDDASPLALDHLRQQRVRDLPVAGKIQRDGFLPGAVGRIDRQRPAAAGIVDQDVDVTQFGDRRRRQFFCSVLLHDVLRDRNHGGASRGLDLLRERLKQIFSPGDRDDAYALQREHLGDCAANPGAGAAHDGGPGLEVEVHIWKLSFC